MSTLLSLKKSQPGAYTVYAPGRAVLWKTESTSKENTPNVGFGVGPLPSSKHKWHIDNALDAKIAASVVHNGEQGFHIHISWLYSSSISQRYMILPILAVYVAAYPDSIPREPSCAIGAFIGLHDQKCINKSIGFSLD
jgi:hypothetical protein